MPLQFQTENFMPQDQTMQQIYSPLFAALGGQQTARIKQSQEQALRDAEEMIRQRQLENIGRQRDAYKAQLEMATPDFMEQKLRGESGTSATQELAGAKAKGLLPFIQAASKEGVTPEEFEAAKTGASRLGTMLADIDPNNISKLEQLQLKQKLQQVKQADVAKLMNWAIATGTPLNTTIDLYLQGNQYLAEKSGVSTTTATPQVPAQPPTAPATPAVTGGGFPTVSPEQQYQRDKDSLLVMQQELVRNPNDAALQQNIANTQRKIAEYEAKGGTGAVQPQQPKKPVDNLLNRAIERKTNSSREARYSDNVAIAANEARTAIQNIASMPFKTTAGIFGSGRKETNLFSGPINSLKNKLSQETTTSYNAEVDNIGSFYARLINGGLSPSQSEIDKFTNQFRVREGEDALTALTRLAQMRQAFERAAEVKLASKATPPEQIDMWKSAVADVKEAIPMTVADVNKFRDIKNPKKSFNEFMQETKRTVDGAAETVTVNGKTYNRPANMNDEQWKRYKKAMGVE